MKKHLMSSYHKEYAEDGSYEYAGIKTYCGKKFDTQAEAVEANVKKGMFVKDDPDACKTCGLLARGYRHQRQMREWGAMKQVF